MKKEAADKVGEAKRAPKKPPIIREQSRNGIRYVYEDHPYWDSTKKQTRHRRVYIGRYNRNGEYIASINRSTANLSDEKKVNAVDVKNLTPKFVGATYLLDQIAKTTGLYDDLKEAFPDNCLQILSLSYYLTLEKTNSYDRFSKWSKTHAHPFQHEMPPQIIRELLSKISEKEKLSFFKKQISRLNGEECAVYEAAPTIFPSDMIKQAKFGFNKDEIGFSQINMVFIMGQESLWPVYYRLLPDSLTETTDVEKLISDLEFFGLRKFNLSLDRESYSESNITKFSENGYNFTICAKPDIFFVAKEIRCFSGMKLDINNFLPEHEVYYHTNKIFMTSQNEIKSRSTKKEDGFNLYVHVYYDNIKALESRIKFNGKLVEALNRVKANKFSQEDKILINKYAIVEVKDENTIDLKINMSLLQSDTEHFGYFILLSNHMADPSRALTSYKNKIFIEKAFCEFPNGFNIGREDVNSPQNFDGEVFLRYISLIFLFHIHKKMLDNNLYANYDLVSLLDELDLIIRYEQNDGLFQYGEISEKQKEIYEYMNVAPLE
jgi:hypothetical protein